MGITVLNGQGAASFDVEKKLVNGRVYDNNVPEEKIQLDTVISKLDDIKDSIKMPAPAKLDTSKLESSINNVAETVTKKIDSIKIPEPAKLDTSKLESSINNVAETVTKKIDSIKMPLYDNSKLSEIALSISKKIDNNNDALTKKINTLEIMALSNTNKYNQTDQYEKYFIYLMMFVFGFATAFELPNIINMFH